ncbi:thiosulfate sulfurtransferase [Gluconacetobacter johannae DSM 13595]|uniref:Sulfurtransferase n=1 Tax=Gluconacetobacter johannae TaxID=112140 RepID=A0A7W4J835_9PROT|nr:sulfurtransferase [Gluconacetobacter johannae]MBB2176344.1 sulfurtransferase [Gluconacetobacter johannae]GBQ91631.1 thiosulfate sulfurtransferase [Gluconacetobacter johannae DSM 13595]
MHPLISPARLLEGLSSSSLVVLDATLALPGENFDPLQRFGQARIPGARYFDIELFSDPDSTLPHMIPSQARFERLARGLGIGGNSHIVFYDQGNAASAARAWWLAGLFGLDRVQVLDGGLPAWLRAGGAVQAGPVQADTTPEGTGPADTATAFRAAPRFGRVYGLGDMKDVVGRDDVLILDARSRGRFDGTAAEPRAGLPSGHMPGAASLPYGDLLDEDRAFLPGPVLRERFIRAGVTDDRLAITTCGSGVSASVLSLGLAACGWTSHALYDGSWTEWASTPGVPIETGPGRRETA